MPVHCVILNQAAEDAVWEKFKQKWPDSHVLTPCIAFVTLAPPQLTSEIREILGMNDTGRRLGVIVKMTPGQYAGYNKPELWEWLKRELQETEP